MNNETVSRYKNLFEEELFEKVIPFWVKHSPDYEHGGYYNCLDRDGTPYDKRKHIWLQGRQAWMFSKFYNKIEPNPKWLEIAKLGVDFLREHAINDDGRVYFAMNEEGQPLWRQRKIFSECFYVMALAEYGRAADRPDLIKEAEEELERIWEWSSDLTQVGRPHYEGQIPSRSLTIPMIMLNVFEEVTGGKPGNYRPEIEECIERMFMHLDEDRKIIYETIHQDGSPLDTIEGRLLSPGNTIEASWFLQHWADHLDRPDIRENAIKMTRWSFNKGWDDEHGGLFYFMDADGYSPTELEWDMKLWWPHTEALYASLLNYSITGDTQDLEMFEQVQEYTFNHFPDDEHDGWYGYLNRHGEVTHRFKGAPYKGFFHVPRCLWHCWQLLDNWDK